MRDGFALAGVLFALFSSTGIAHDSDTIQGEWQCVAMELGHKETTDQDVKATTVSITKSRIAFRFGGDCRSCELDWKLQPNTDPKQIDMSVELDDEVQHVKGIYRLDGGSLEICIGDGDGDRPAEFKMDKEKHFQWMRLERVK